MALQQFPYDQRCVDEQGELFPEEVYGDSWVAFHGSTGGREQAIETEGLRWSENVTKSDVAKVVSIYRRMAWTGLSAGGLAVLEPFTLGHDFGKEAKKPVYLAEFSLRALTFATRDFAGGETLRALRYAIGDLEAYLSSNEVRTEHSQGRGRRWAVGTNDETEVDLDWLRGELSQLSTLREQCGQALTNHGHGVVYAIRFDAGDLERLNRSGSMGIEAHGEIAPSKLIAKVRVPASVKVPFDLPDAVRGRYLNRLSDPNSLLGQLSKR